MIKENTMQIQQVIVTGHNDVCLLQTTNQEMIA